MKLFETFKIKDEHLEAVKTLSDYIDEDRVLLGEVGARFHAHRAMLFVGINELYPELANYEYVYDHKEHTIKITGYKNYIKLKHGDKNGTFNGK